jgi:methylated-DNA-[protein]-cysteine S-methyltransferase
MNAMPERLHYSLVDTSYGEITVIWEAGEPLRAVRILLPSRRGELGTVYPQATESTDSEISDLTEDIARFLEGEDVVFNLDLMDLDQCSQFQRSVILAEYGVPRGYVTTYGRLARQVGAPRASRAAGRALATNPFPIVIPCHRAVRSNGSLGGYQGGVEMKARLLEMEGVQVERGRVLMNRVFY